MGDLLDTDAEFLDHYTLEVSSPGVERKLKKPSDFERFQGQKARVVLHESEGADAGKAKKRTLEGVLAGTDADAVVLEVNGDRIRVPFASIDKANLKFEW